MKSFKYIFLISLTIVLTIRPVQCKLPTFEFLDVYDNISLGGYVKETSHSILKPNRISYAFTLNKNANKWLSKVEFHMLAKNERRISLFKSDVNMCQYQKWATKNNFFFVMLNEMVRKSNYPKNCQLEANKEYFVNNYTLRNTDYPGHTPDLTFLIILDIHLNETPAMVVFIKGLIKRD